MSKPQIGIGSTRPGRAVEQVASLGESTDRINRPWMPHPPQRAARADPDAREFLRKADPVLARLIEVQPDFRARAWMDELPPLDAFGTLIFQITGQQLSVRSTRAIISRLQQHFGDRMPSPAELLAADPQALRDSGFSGRKSDTLRALAQRFVDGPLREEAFSAMTDDEIEAALTAVPGIGPWTARGFLLVALNRPDVYLSGDLALRRAIQREYAFDHLPTDQELIELSDAGDRTGAWPSATCSRRNTAERSKRRLGIAWVSQVSDRVCGRWSRKRAQRPA